MKLSGLAKNLLLSIGIAAAVFMAVSAAVYRSAACLPFIWGVLLGAATAAVKVVLLEKTVDKALTMDEKAVVNFTRLHHLLRLVLSGAVLLVAALVPGINLWGAAAGILTFQIAVYAQRFFPEK